MLNHFWSVLKVGVLSKAQAMRNLCHVVLYNIVKYMEYYDAFVSNLETFYNNQVRTHVKISYFSNDMTKPKVKDEFRKWVKDESTY